MKQFLYSFLNLLLGLFFILFGLLIVLLPTSLTIQARVVQFIQESFYPWNFFGLAFICIGIAFIGYFSHTAKKRYITLKSGPSAALISEAVVSDYLTSYLEKTFPHQEIPYQFAFKKNKIKVAVDLPFIPKEDQASLQQIMHHDIQEIMHDYLGCMQPLDLSLSFSKK